MRILVAEDDRSVCEMLALFLDKEGYEARFVHDGREALAEWEREAYDLLILDWMLPGMDGIAVCCEVRKTSRVPIILLTARTQEADQVLGLELGADDYVTKPFSPLALLARIKAVMRRCRPAEASSETAEEGVIRTKRWAIHPDTREVFLDGRPVTGLTPKEFDLLCFMARHPRRVFTRQELLDGVWGYDFYGDERTVDAHVKRLRRKIAVPGHPWVHTVWGVGYKFEEAGSEDE